MFYQTWERIKSECRRCLWRQLAWLKRKKLSWTNAMLPKGNSWRVWFQVEANSRQHSENKSRWSFLEVTVSNIIGWEGRGTVVLRARVAVLGQGGPWHTQNMHSCALLCRERGLHVGWQRLQVVKKALNMGWGIHFLFNTFVELQ